MYIDDLADALALLLERGKPGEAYNVATQVEKSVEEIADAVLTKFGGDSMAEILPRLAAWRK